jgi:hypothetical protein
MIFDLNTTENEGDVTDEAQNEAFGANTDL